MEGARNLKEAADRAGIVVSPKDGGLTFQQSALRDFECNKIGMEEYAKLLGAYLGVTPDQAMDVYRAIPIRESPGATALVKALNDKNILTTCLSNTSELLFTQAMKDIDHYEVLYHIRRRILSYHTGYLKPDTMAYKDFASRLSLVDLGELVFFDDVTENVQGALAAGWKHSYWVPANQAIEPIRQTLARVLNW